MVFASATLAHVLDLGGGRNQLQYFGRDQIVVKHNVSGAQQPQSFQREQFGIARACAHQIDFALHAVTLRLFRSELRRSFLRILLPVPLESFTAGQRVQQFTFRSGSRSLASTSLRVVAQFRDPLAHSPGQTAARVAAGFFAPGKDFARWSRLQSADRRGAPRRDSRSRNIPERPPHCTELRDAALRGKWIRSGRVTQWRQPQETFRRDHRRRRRGVRA